MLLEDRVAFTPLPSTASSHLLNYFLTTENDLLEKKDVIFSVDFHLHDHENVVQDKFAEIRQMVALPILHSLFKARNCLQVLRSPLRFIDPICYTLGSFKSQLQLAVIRIVGLVRCFQKGLITHENQISRVP